MKLEPQGQPPKGSGLPSARGGNLTFRVGAGRKEQCGFQHPGGDFIFELGDGKEFMRITSEGVATVRGSVVATDKAVFDAFAEWVKDWSVVVDPGPT